MNFRSLSTTFAIAGMAFAFLIAAPVSAAKFTFAIEVDDADSCKGTWQTGGSAKSPTLVCVPDGTTPPPVGAAPTCSATQSQTVSANTVVALTLANCTVSDGAAITYAWYVGNTSGTPVSQGSSTYNTTAVTATTTYYGVATANGRSTTYPITLTVNAVPPPVSACSNYGSVARLGAIPFDGSRVVSEGMKGATIAYGTLQVPAQLPTGWLGRTSQISVYEYGSAKLFRMVYLSKSPCDFTANGSNWTMGNGTNLYLSWGVDTPGHLTIKPGETWYLNIKHQYPGGAPSCFATVNCNFAVTAGLPGQ